MHLGPGPRADLPQHLAALADQDALLAAALHQHRGQHRRARAVVDDALDLHGHRVGHLFAGVVEHLLADQLGQQQLFGLVADRITGVEVGAFGQLGGQGVHQGGGAIATQGADAVQGPAGHQLPVAGLQRVGGVGRHQVALVEGHLHRHLGAGQQFDDEAIAASCGLAAIDQQQHLIHLADGGPGALHQPLTQ